MQLEIIRNLDKGAFTIRVCCLYKLGAIGRAIAGRDPGVCHGLMANRYDLFGAWRLFRTLKKERIDLLCLQDSPLTLFWGYVCGRLLKIPSVITIVHGMSESGRMARVKAALVNSIIMRRLDRVIVVSKAKKDLLAKRYNLKEDRLLLINNGVDTDRFLNPDNGGLREKLGLRGREKVVGMVGRLVTEKAYDIFLRSARRVVSDFPDARFLIVGDGDERPALEGLAGALGIRDKVFFLGEREDVPGLVSIFDIAVLSSRMESFPVVLLEYMAAGKPIVTTGVGGNAEIVSDGKTGLMVPPEDPEALAGAIMELLRDPKKAEGMGKAARETVKDDFSLKDMIRRVESSFLGCIKDKEGGARC